MRHWTARIFQIVVFLPILLILKVIFGFKVKLDDKLNLKEVMNEPKIFPSNHTNKLDGIIVAASIFVAMIKSKFSFSEFVRFAPVRFLAFENYFRWFSFKFPIVFPISLIVAGWLRLSACIPVKSRKKSERDKVTIYDVLAEAISALRDRENVSIFLEGMVCPGKSLFFPESGVAAREKLQRGKKGVAALHKAVPESLIIPIGLEGTFKMFHPWNIFLSILRIRRVSVKIGAPMKLYNPKPNRTLEEGVDMVTSRIAQLLED